MRNALIVDDDDIVRTFMSRILNNKFDCEVRTAENGLEALTEIEEQIPDVIFLDITMPYMDGLEALGIIRKDEKFSGIPVVMLTALADKDTVQSCVDLGISGYLL